MRSAPFLTLEPRQSRLAVLAFSVVVLLAFAAVWRNDLPTTWCAILMMLVVVALVVGMLQLRRPILLRAVLQSDGIWLLSTRKGEIAAHLQSSAMLPGLISLTWCDTLSSGVVTSVLLWPDALPESTSRQLRVWLRSGRAHHAEPPIVAP